MGSCVQSTSMVPGRDFPDCLEISSHASNAGDMGWRTGQGAKIPRAMWCGQKIKSKTMTNTKFQTVPDTRRILSILLLGLPYWLRDKESKCCWFDLWVGKIPWRRVWPPTPIFLPWRGAWQAVVQEFAKRVGYQLSN